MVPAHLVTASDPYPETAGGRAQSWPPDNGDGSAADLLLREALARERVLHLRIGELIQQQEGLAREADHRMSNCLQLIAGLLWRQSQASPNAEIAAQLAVAADRVIVVGHLHRHPHSRDGAETVAIKGYLEDLCHDLSALLGAERSIAVEGIDVELASRASLPLGFIAHELVMNAVKHGEGRILLKLEAGPERGYALSVSNDGPALPNGFDGGACKGLGMKIIRSCVDRIGGELRIGRNDDNEGARFTVLFAGMSGIGHN